MNEAGAWISGTVDDEVTGRGSLRALLSGTGLAIPDGRRQVIVPVVCRYCAHDEFEVAAGECHCVGCCLPIGIEDGEVYSGTPVWKLLSADVSPPESGAVVRKPSSECCPAGHGVFLVGVAYAFAAHGGVGSVSVGLECPEDGMLCLHVDDARVVSTKA
ncbi:hypothetical protein [Embleya sp. AB8]|uniref:hypothetical protein n=1 Tax=Embleya sp. AB8 TaxID=3156304 RepID=UPI003C76ABA9